MKSLLIMTLMTLSYHAQAGNFFKFNFFKLASLKKDLKSCTTKNTKVFLEDKSEFIMSSQDDDLNEELKRLILDNCNEEFSAVITVEKANYAYSSYIIFPANQTIYFHNNKIKLRDMIRKQKLQNDLEKRKSKMFKLKREKQREKNKELNSLHRDEKLKYLMGL